MTVVHVQREQILPLSALPHKHQPLTDLKSHSAPYVTVGALASYWGVSRRQIYKQIEAGTLPSLRLGPRVVRVRTVDAYRCERLAGVRPRA